MRFGSVLNIVVFTSLCLVFASSQSALSREDHLEANLEKGANDGVGNPWTYSVRVEPQPQKRVTFRELKDRLDRNDFLAALKALNVALDEVGDGATFLWRRKNHGLKGAIKPTAAFRSADGRICRSLVFSLYLSGYVKSIESVACRKESGQWIVGG